MKMVENEAEETPELPAKAEEDSSNVKACLGRIEDAVKDFGNRCDKIEKYLSIIEDNTRDGIESMPWYRKRDDTVVVYIRISITNVGIIDIAQQTFECEFYLSVRWKEPMLKDMIGKEDEIDWQTCWEPGICFIDMKSHNIFKRTCQLVASADGGDPIVHQYYHVQGVFEDIFDVRYFPFDYQSLTLTLSSVWSEKWVKFRSEPTRNHNIRTWNFSDVQQWDLQQHVLGWSTPTPIENGASENVFPLYKFKMHVHRKYGYFVINIAMTMCLITVITFVSYAKRSDRIGTMLTLLLTTVAMKFINNQYVPRVSYLSWLDAYILWCMMFQFAMTIIHGVAAFLESNKYPDLNSYDLICFIVLMSIFVLSHIIFGIIALKFHITGTWMALDDSRSYKKFKIEARRNAALEDARREETRYDESSSISGHPTDVEISCEDPAEDNKPSSKWDRFVSTIAHQRGWGSEHPRGREVFLCQHT